MLKHFKLQTAERDVVSLTEEIKAFVEGSGIREGLCTICTPHTTAGLTITSFWDGYSPPALTSSTSTTPPRTRRDM